MRAKPAWTREEKKRYWRDTTWKKWKEEHPESRGYNSKYAHEKEYSFCQNARCKIPNKLYRIGTGCPYTDGKIELNFCSERCRDEFAGLNKII